MISAGGQTGGGDCFTKPVASRNAMEVQTLLLPKPVKKFASDKDEGVDSYFSYKWNRWALSE